MMTFHQNCPRGCAGGPSKRGRPGNPSGRRRGSRNKATLAAATLLAGESEASTRKAVEMALAGDPALHGTRAAAVPRAWCQVPSAADRGHAHGDTCGPSSRDVSQAMNAVTSALAQGEITPGETETIAGVVDTFVRAIETTKKEGSRLNLLPILMANNYYNCEKRETGDYEETDDCDLQQAGRAGRPMRAVGASTSTGPFAADLLQVQPSATIDSIHDCRFGDWAAPSQ